MKVLKRFSKRAQQRDAVVKEMEEKLGRKLSNNDVAHGGASEPGEKNQRHFHGGSPRTAVVAIVGR